MFVEWLRCLDERDYSREKYDYLFSQGQITALLALLKDISSTVSTGKPNSCNAQMPSMLRTGSETQKQKPGRKYMLPSVRISCPSWSMVSCRMAWPHLIYKYISSPEGKVCKRHNQVEGESHHPAVEENIRSMEKWRLPYYHEQAELGTHASSCSTTDLLHGTGKLTSVLIFSLLLYRSMDKRRPPGVREGAEKNLAIET